MFKLFAHHSTSDVCCFLLHLHSQISTILTFILMMEVLGRWQRVFYMLSSKTEVLFHVFLFCFIAAVIVWNTLWLLFFVWLPLSSTWGFVGVTVTDMTDG